MDSGGVLDHYGRKDTPNYMFRWDDVKAVRKLSEAANRSCNGMVTECVRVRKYGMFSGVVCNNRVVGKSRSNLSNAFFVYKRYALAKTCV
jgi:hypothetical protein